MLLDLIDLSKLRKILAYALLLAGLFIVQNLVLTRLRLWGVCAMIIPAAVAAVGLFEEGMWGAMVGLAAGYFYDMSTTHVVMFTILLTAIGFFAEMMGKFMLHRGFMSYMALALLSLTLAAFCQMFRFLFLMDADTQAFQQLYLGGSAVWRILRRGLIQVLWGLVWSIPLYFPCKRIAAMPMGH